MSDAPVPCDPPPPRCVSELVGGTPVHSMKSPTQRHAWAADYINSAVGTTEPQASVSLLTRPAAAARTTYSSPAPVTGRRSLPRPGCLQLRGLFHVPTFNEEDAGATLPDSTSKIPSKRTITRCSNPRTLNSVLKISSLKKYFLIKD